MIDSIHEKTKASILRICKVLGFPTSSYYAVKTPTMTPTSRTLKSGTELKPFSKKIGDAMATAVLPQSSIVKSWSAQNNGSGDS